MSKRQIIYGLIMRINSNPILNNLSLPKIISGLKKQGYEFVTIPELLTIKDRELNKQELAKQQNQNQ